MDDKRRDPEATKAALLDAALVEFSAHGMAGARTSAIAARAGVNKQLISHHFGGKRGLYRALIDRWLREEAEYGVPEQPLGDLLAAYVASGVRDRELHRLLLRASLEGEETGAGVGAEDLEEMRRRQGAGEVSDRLDPAFVLLALEAVAALGIVFPGDAEALTGLDPASAEFAAWHERQARALVELLGSAAG
jgi:AcrR family transcriptional regulator